MAQRRLSFPRNTIPIPVTVEAWLLLASVVGAVIIVKTDALAEILAHVQGYDVPASFISGFLFSSGIVTPLAIGAFLESAKYIPAIELAVIGSVGAVCGDLLLFRFVRSQLVEYILRAALSPKALRFSRMIAKGPLWWVAPIMGAVVIASPLPDELGLLMMGISSIRLVQFVPLAFAANVAGIYIIVLAAQTFSS